MLGGRPVDARVDTSRWNLFSSGAWSTGIAVAALACGPVIGTPEGDTDDPSDPTESTNPSDPSDPSDPSGPDPTQGDCVSDSDCSYGYSCIDSFCQYDCYCGCGASPPPGSQLRCSEGPGYECYGDYNCADDEFCDEYGSCQPDPEPVDCRSIPVSAASFELLFTADADAVVSELRFADVWAAEPGLELLAARGPTLELATSSGKGAILVQTTDDIISFATGDLDGDAVLDIVTAEDGDGAILRFWRGVDGGFVATEIAQPLVGARELFIADRDADGVSEVYAHADRDLLVFPSTQGVPLGEGLRLLDDRVDQVAPLDTKGDGEIDFLFTESGSIWIYRELQSPEPDELYGTDADLFAPIVVADFSGDAEPDAATFSNQGEQVTFVGEVGTTPGLADLSTAQTHSSAGDIDGDGRADLVILEPEVGSVLVRFGADAGASKGLDAPFRCDTRYAIEAVGHRIAAGDFDGDGRAELAVADGGLVLLVRF